MKRRTFPAEFKVRILREADRCHKPGELAALLSREGLRFSHLAAWRAARARGESMTLAPQRRGPKPRREAGDERVAALERQLERVLARLDACEARLDECDTAHGRGESPSPE